jgi:hypothetical protein
MLLLTYIPAILAKNSIKLTTKMLRYKFQETVFKYRVDENKETYPQEYKVKKIAKFLKCGDLKT